MQWNCRMLCSGEPVYIRQLRLHTYICKCYLVRQYYRNNARYLPQATRPIYFWSYDREIFLTLTLTLTRSGITAGILCDKSKLTLGKYNRMAVLSWFVITETASMIQTASIEQPQAVAYTVVEAVLPIFEFRRTHITGRIHTHHALSVDELAHNAIEFNVKHFSLSWLLGYWSHCTINYVRPTISQLTTVYGSLTMTCT